MTSFRESWSRRPGRRACGVVWTELLNFDGDEIYFQKEPTLIGRTFGESLFAYEDSCVMGLARADRSILINPPMDTIIADDDAIIALSRDDDAVITSSVKTAPDERQIVPRPAKKPREMEQILILGWNRKALRVFRQLEFAAPSQTS